MVKLPPGGPAAGQFGRSSAGRERPARARPRTWSKGGATDLDNCQMLCKTHNRAKGNR